MATVIGITVAKAEEIEDASVVSGAIINGDLFLTRGDGSTFNAGSVTDYADGILASHQGDTSTHGVGEVVGRTETQTITNKTLTSPVINTPTVNSGTLVTPTIASHVNAQHDHGAAADGGVIDLAANGITGKSQMHFGSVAGTPGPGGALTIAHGAPFSPTFILASVQDTDSALVARKGIVCNVVSDTVGGVNFQVRLYRNDTAASHEGLCRVTYVCMT